MTAITKTIYFDVLDNIVDQCNNTYYTTIKMKSIDVKSNSYAKYNVDSYTKDAKFKIGNHLRISKYKNIFVKGYAPNFSEEVFVISKIKNTVPGHMLLVILMVKEVLYHFIKKITEDN